MSINTRQIYICDVCSKNYISDHTPKGWIELLCVTEKHVCSGCAIIITTETNRIKKSDVGGEA